jgi:hypothetical protein
MLAAPLRDVNRYRFTDSIAPQWTDESGMNIARSAFTRAAAARRIPTYELSMA